MRYGHLGNGEERIKLYHGYSLLVHRDPDYPKTTWMVTLEHDIYEDSEIPGNYAEDGPGMFGSKTAAIEEAIYQLHHRKDCFFSEDEIKEGKEIVPPFLIKKYGLKRPEELIEFMNVEEVKQFVSKEYFWKWSKWRKKDYPEEWAKMVAHSDSRVRYFQSYFGVLL